MDRRSFFKTLLSGIAVAAAGIELLPSTKTIFLPPTLGWWQPPLRMREVQQYLINNDSLPMRYDVRWEKPSGEMIQYHVHFDQYSPLTRPHCEPPADVLEHQRQVARVVFERIEREHGFKRIHQVELQLPYRTANIARYV